MDKDYGFVFDGFETSVNGFTICFDRDGLYHHACDVDGVRYDPYVITPHGFAREYNFDSFGIFYAMHTDLVMFIESASPNISFTTWRKHNFKHWSYDGPLPDYILECFDDDVTGFVDEVLSFHIGTE